MGFTHPANEQLVSSKLEYVRKVKIMFDTERIIEQSIFQFYRLRKPKKIFSLT